MTLLATRTRHGAAALAAASLILCCTCAFADVKLPPLLSSHMVLQRDMADPIWGTAAPSEKVTVSFRGQQKTATADAAGQWLVKLDPLPAGGPDTLTVAGANTLTLEDVLVGEVWLGSGQSNMALGAGHFTPNDPGLARIIAAAPYPQLRIVGRDGRWGEGTSANCVRASALMLAFGAQLQQALGIPVGIMVGAVSGTPSGFWLSREAFDSDAGVKAAIARFSQTYNYDEEVKQYPAKLAAWEARDAHARQVGRSAGPKPQPPRRPGECTGVIGNLYEAHIRPLIPYGIRGVFWDQGEAGTAIEGVDQFSLMGALIRGWRKDWGEGDFPWIYTEKPSGGGTAFNPDDPVTNKADALAPLPAEVPTDLGYPGKLRDTHTRIMAYLNTAMVIATDLGGGTHPTNKSGYGARAAREALGLVYARPVETYGPTFQSYKVQGGKVRVSFTHVGQGLASRPADKLQGFAIAGEDHKWVWADAVIDGDSVVLSSDKVPAPVAVRYAWAATIPWANLFNKEGLPALPFRTDDW